MNYDRTGNAVVVKRAIQMSSEHEFASSCSDEVGRLLQILSGLKSNSKVAEIGTGFGVGTAWMLSELDPESTLWTVELDAQRVGNVSKLFEGIANVQLLQGDWKQVLTYAPFDFVFVDAKPAKNEEAGLLIETVRLNGIILLDDFTPIEHWPEEWRGKPDMVREKWLNNDRLLCTELRTSERNSVLIARRIR